MKNEYLKKKKLKKKKQSKESETIFNGFVKHNLAQDQSKASCKMNNNCIFFIAVYSFVNLTKNLLLQTRVKAILSQNLSKDPLEEYFSRKRCRRGLWQPYRWQIQKHYIVHISRQHPEWFVRHCVGTPGLSDPSVTLNL